MTRIGNLFVSASLFVAAAAPAYASAPIPAPIVGAGLSGFVVLGLAAGGGYLYTKWRGRRD